MRESLRSRVEALEAKAPAGQPFIVFTPEPLSDADLATLIKSREVSPRSPVVAFHWLPMQ